MSQYLKPQSPLYNEGHDEFIYPITTASQVIDEETGHRLDVEGVFKRDVLTLEEMSAVTGSLDDYAASASSLHRLNTAMVTPLVQVDISKLPNCQSGYMYWTRIGNLVIGAYNNMKFSDASSALVEHAAALSTLGMPGNAILGYGNPGLNSGVLTTECWITGQNMYFRTLRNDRNGYGVFFYITDDPWNI